MNEEIINGAAINDSGGAATSTIIDAALLGYAVTASARIGIFDVVGALDGYAVSANATVFSGQGIVADISGYAVTVDAYGGAVAEVQGYAVTAQATVTERPQIRGTLEGYAVSASGVTTGLAGMDGRIQGYVVSAQAYGGADITCQGYSVTASAFVSAQIPVTAQIQGYAVTARAMVSARATIVAEAEGYAVNAEAYSGAVIEAGGYAISVSAYFAGVSQEDHNQAFVMNTHTSEVTRYLNYYFKHLLMIDGKPYGVRHDGLYALVEDHDETALNGYVITKDTDFGDFAEKRVPYAYLNNDTQVKITPILNDKAMIPHLSSFAGRKTHLARGLSARYWTFRIDQIKQLEGITFEPQLTRRQRKVR